MKFVIHQVNKFSVCLLSYYRWKTSNCFSISVRIMAFRKRVCSRQLIYTKDEIWLKSSPAFNNSAVRYDARTPTYYCVSCNHHNNHQHTYHNHHRQYHRHHHYRHHRHHHYHKFMPT